MIWNHDSEAAQMARVTVEFIGQALDFDKLDGAPLNAGAERSRSVRGAGDLREDREGADGIQGEGTMSAQTLT